MTDLDVAREVSRLRAVRGNNASAAVQADLGAIVLPGDAVSRVAAALLATRRLLEAQFVTDRALGRSGDTPPRLLTDVVAAHEALKDASRRMDP